MKLYYHILYPFYISLNNTITGYDRQSEDHESVKACPDARGVPLNWRTVTARFSGCEYGLITIGLQETLIGKPHQDFVN